jgi:uncharacterized protein YjiS (DUF1127 family)
MAMQIAVDGPPRALVRALPVKQVPSWPGGLPWLTRPRAALTMWRRYVRDARQLRRYDDRLLHDMGLRRAEIDHAVWHGVAGV